MTRRCFARAAACLVAFAGQLAAPSSVFARSVRQSHKRLNRSGLPNIERQLAGSFSHTTLEDAEAFHRLVEKLRLSMLKALSDVGEPINVWRVGQITIRTRTSVEHPPFIQED